MSYAGTWSVGYVFLMEQLPRSKRHWIIWIDLTSGLSLAWIAIFISLFDHFRRDWRFFQQINLIVISLTNINIMLFASDSPIYLLAVGRREKAFKVLKSIASWNSSSEPLHDYMVWRKINTSDKQNPDSA